MLRILGILLFAAWSHADRPITMFNSSTVPSFQIAGMDRMIPRWISGDMDNFKLIKESAELSSSDLFVDAGCNHGFYTFYAAAIGMRVGCFEIQPGMIKLLYKSMAENGFQGKVSIHHVGVSNTSGYSGVHFAGGLSHLVEGRGEKCRVLPLDRMVKEPARFMKIDVEGNEIVALQGAHKLMFYYGVDYLLIEIGPARWERSGVSLAMGIAELVYLMDMRYLMYLIPRGDNQCPSSYENQALTKTTMFGVKLLQLNGSHQVHPLMTQMHQRQWDCNFFFSKRSNGTDPVVKWKDLHSSLRTR